MKAMNLPRLVNEKKSYFNAVVAAVIAVVAVVDFVVVLFQFAVSLFFSLLSLC